MRQVVRLELATALGLAFALAAWPTSAHETATANPTLVAVLTSWSLDPLVLGGTLLGAAAYLFAVRRVDRIHPQTPVSRWRIAAWLGGLAVILLALLSAIDPYADELLSVHMVQHLLLSMIAPPLLALGAPIILLLRAASPEARRTLILPVLHSRVVRVVTSPFVAWPLFALVMWVAHFSPLYEAALENPALHSAEHLVFLGSAALFWWPAVAVDPSPRRLGYGTRLGYLLLQMPVGAAIGLRIYFSPVLLYPHYGATGRSWGPSPIVDQQIGGLLMWAAGELVLLAAVVAVVAAWMRADARRSIRLDARLRLARDADTSARANTPPS